MVVAFANLEGTYKLLLRLYILDVATIAIVSYFGCK